MRKWSSQTTKNSAFAILLLTFILILHLNITLNKNELPPCNFSDNHNPQLEEEVILSVKMESCGCHRNIRIRPTANTTLLQETTCSQDAYSRGPNQRVIAMSVYNTNDTGLEARRRYFAGIEANLKQMPLFYPGYTMRVYHHGLSKSLREQLCHLACHNNALDLCDAKNLPGNPMTDATELFPMIWRFFPTLDPQVDIVHVRDLDSIFSSREHAAVREFLASDKPMHCMRDNINHTPKVLGGMWGAKLNTCTRSVWVKSWKGMLSDYRSKACNAQGLWYKLFGHGPDQQLLAAYPWKFFGGGDGCLQHDSYWCSSYPGSVPWPTKRLKEPNNFVGSIVSDNETLKQKCPVECRPEKHKDWYYC